MLRLASLCNYQIASISLQRCSSFLPSCLGPAYRYENNSPVPIRANADSTGLREPGRECQRSYDEAFQPFFADRGIRYPCLQSDIDLHRWNTFLGPNACPFPAPNLGPFVSRIEATSEVMWQNDQRRKHSVTEHVAIADLQYLVRVSAERRIGQDIVVKAFDDLDTVFFGGRPRGNVVVSWASDARAASLNEQSNLSPVHPGGVLHHFDILVRMDSAALIFVRGLFSYLLQ